eukprot:11578838-Ditylum_brightwellii.AAC.1
MEPRNLAEEDLGSHTPTNNNGSVSTTNLEGNGVNNITVTQMVGDLRQDARTPIVNPYYSSSNTTRRTGRDQNQNQNRKFQDMVFDKDKDIHNRKVISMVMQDLNFILPATV